MLTFLKASENLELLTWDISFLLACGEETIIFRRENYGLGGADTLPVASHLAEKHHSLC